MFVEWICDNMKKIIILLILILCISSGCNKKVLEKTDAIRFKEEFEKLNEQTIENTTYQTVTIPEDNAIVYSSIEEILALLENGTAIIYFGAPDDFASRREIETLLNTANMVGIEKIYYLNITEIRDIKYLDTNKQVITEKEGTKEYYQLLDTLNSFLPVYEGLNDATIKRIYFPTTIFLKEGKIIGFHTGIESTKTNPTTVLTDQEEKELAIAFSTYMHDILKDACNKDC